MEVCGRRRRRRRWERGEGREEWSVVGVQVQGRQHHLTSGKMENDAGEVLLNSEAECVFD
jgi:hypothetical protein